MQLESDRCLASVVVSGDYVQTVHGERNVGKREIVVVWPENRKREAQTRSGGYTFLVWSRRKNRVDICDFWRDCENLSG